MLPRAVLRRAGRAAGILGLVVALVGALLLSSTTALAKNPGSFWLDNAGSIANPGHVPHLSGDKDINMIASYPGSGSGTFEIVAWSPTGDNKTVVYQGSWVYSPGKGDPQVVGVVDVGKLIANTHFTAHTRQGYHFKITCSGDYTQKTKEFWVAAPTLTPSPSPSAAPTPSPSASPSATNVQGATIGLADTGGPLLGIGLLLMLLGGSGWLLNGPARRRS